MGTLAAPNLLITLTDFSSGAVDTGKSVEIVLHGDAYPGDAIALSEIGVTGKYKYETSVGVAAITQGMYEVYADAVFVALFQHGLSAVQDHMDSVSNPHTVVAAQISIADSGSLITAETVEAALQEIVTAVNTKASSGSTVLTDNSTQSVSSSKPVVTNLDADKVDGKHVGFSVNQIPYLERDAREDITLRLDAIPRDLTGKNADKLDGYHAGSSGGQIPILSANVEAGRIHTSLQNIAQGYANNQIPRLLSSKGATGLHTTLLNKEVGSGDLMIPQLSTVKTVGKLSTTLMNREVGTGHDMIPLISTGAGGDAGMIAKVAIIGQNPGTARSASDNLSEILPPDKYGGGSIWMEKGIPNNITNYLIDDSMDWRDRFINFSGYLNSANDTTLPGEATDYGIDANMVDTQAAPIGYQITQGFLYTQEGTTRAGWGATSPEVIIYENVAGNEDGLVLWVDNSNGYLWCGKAVTTYSNEYSVMLKIDYSPKQNHY